MKTKKILAVLLAVLLIAGSLPMTVMAAPGADAKISIDITASTAFGGTLTNLARVGNNDGTEEANVTIANYNTYSAQLQKLGYNSLGVVTAEALEESFEFNSTQINNLYTGSNEITAKAGDQIFVGVSVKFSGKNADGKDYLGAKQKTINLLYDSTIFTPNADNTAIHAVNNGNAVGRSIKNNWAEVPIFYEDSDFSDWYSGVTTQGTGLGIKEDPSGYINDESETIPNTNLSSINLSLTAMTAGYYVPTQNNTWDFVVPVTIADSAPVGSYQIWIPTVIETATGNDAGTTVALTPDKSNESGTDFASATLDTFKIGMKGTGTNANADVFDITPVTIKVERQEVGLTASKEKIAKGASSTDVSTVDVTLSNGTFTSTDAVVAGDFTVTVTQAAGGSTTVTPTVKDVTSSKATLEMDLSTLAVGDKLTIQYTNESNVTKTEGYSWPSGGPVTGNVEVVDKLSGTISYTGTQKYGQKVTAALSSAPSDVVYTWYAGDNTTPIHTGAELTLGKITGVTYGDGGTKIYAKATSANADNTSVTDATGFVPEQIEVTLPTPTGITISKDDSDGVQDTATTIDLTTSEGIVSGDKVTVSYTATFKTPLTVGPKTDVTVNFTNALGGADAAYYKLPSTLKLTNQNGEVTDKGYNLTLSGPSGLDLATKTYAGGAGVDIEVTGLKDYEALDTVSATEGVGVTVKNRNTITVTAPVIETAKAVTITVTVKPNVKELTPSDFTWADKSKTYDGDTTGDVTATVIGANIYGDKPGVTLTVTSTYDTADVTGQANKEITINSVELGGGDKDYYKLSDDFAENATITNGEITAADMTAATASGVTMSTATSDAALAAIKKTEITPTTADGPMPVVSGADLTWDDTKLTTAITDAVKALEIPEDQVVVNTSQNIAASTATVTANNNVGDSITLTVDASLLPNHDASSVTFTATTLAGATLDGDTIVFTGAPSGDIEIKAMNTNTSTEEVIATVTVTGTVNPAVYGGDVTKVPERTPLNLTIPFDAITAGLENYSSTKPANFTLELQYQKPAAPSAGVTVTFDAQQYAIPEYSTATVDSEGKLDDVPGVTSMVKGAVFAGWSTTGTKAGIIDIDTFKTDSDVTLYGVFDGYIMGNAKNEINAGDDVTRAELIKMLVVAAGYYDADVDYGDTGFTDTNGWYKNYIACAVKNTTGVIDGYTDGSFKPNAPVTRQEAAKFISGIMGVNVVEGATVDALADFDTLPDWAKPYVAALYNTGAIDGRPNGNYDGKANITREETAKIINTFIGLTAEEEAAIVADTTITAPFVDMVSREKWSYAHLIFASLNAPVDYYSTQVVIPTR